MAVCEEGIFLEGEALAAALRAYTRRQAAESVQGSWRRAVRWQQLTYYAAMGKERARENSLYQLLANEGNGMWEGGCRRKGREKEAEGEGKK